MPTLFEIEVEFATINGIRRILSGPSRPLIIHFIGHGISTSDTNVALMMEDDTGIARPLDIDRLRELLGPYARST
jgi:hypothetical protein